MKETPKGWPRISASVFYEDPKSAIDFLAKAFGFEVQVKHEENGVIVHSQLVIPGGLVMVGVSCRTARQTPSGARAPSSSTAGTPRRSSSTSTTPTPTARARALRARRSFESPTTVDYGKEWWSDRGYEAVDPEGHHWSFAHRVR